VTPKSTYTDLIILLVVGTLWHYLYDWTGGNDLIAVVAPINESVWEHLKLGYGGTIMLVVLDVVRRRANTYILGRVVGLVAMNLLIVVGFYGYFSVLGRPFLPFDLALFVLGCFVAWRLAVVVETKPLISLAAWTSWLGWLMFILVGMVFGLFTVQPPEAEIFVPFPH